eukprot:scaffold419215_cov34-Prasinocladus_malaysianus.AAC.1
MKRECSTRTRVMVASTAHSGRACYCDRQRLNHSPHSSVASLGFGLWPCIGSGGLVLRNCSN